MKAFLIDPIAKQITEVDIDPAVESINKLIGATCEIPTPLAVTPSHDDLLVDFYGSIANGVWYFHVMDDDGQVIDRQKHVMVGRGVVIDHDILGQACAPRVTLERLQALVEFGASP